MTERSDGVERIARELSQLGSDHEPPSGWEDRVLGSIARERLEREIGKLGADHEPPADWQARVLAATARPERPKRRWWTFALPAFALAAAVGVVVVPMMMRDDPPPKLHLAVDITYDGPEHMRGSSSATARRTTAVLNSRLHAAARGGGRHRALWIYRRDLVLACPGDTSCRSSPDELRADLALAVPGEYIILALSSGAPIAPPTGVYDTDRAAANSPGIEVDEHIVEVR